MAFLAPQSTSQPQWQPQAPLFDSDNSLLQALSALLQDPTTGALGGGGFRLAGKWGPHASRFLRALDDMVQRTAEESRAADPLLPEAWGQLEVLPSQLQMARQPKEALTGGGAINPSTFKSVLMALEDKYGSLANAEEAQRIGAYADLARSLGVFHGAKTPGMGLLKGLRRGR